MSTTPKQEDALQRAALSEQERRDPASSVPLSQYLQTNVDSDDDGWKIYASDEEEKPRVDRPRDLSVLKSIKRFLAEETPRDVGDDASSFDGNSYRVDYPFYDGEPSTPSQETTPVSYSFNEQITFEPTSVRYEKVETAPNSHERSEGDSEKSVGAEISTAPEELDESENVEPIEKTIKTAAEETSVAPVEPARAESDANEEIVVAPKEQTFVVEFGELTDAAFDRLEQGVAAPEPPLITSNALARKRRATPPVSTPEPWQTSVPCEPSYVVENVEPTCVRRDREPKSKLAIFRRFVNMIGKKEEREASGRDDVPTLSAPVETPVEISDERSGVDYGETVAFAVAPSFPEAETFCSDAYPLTPR